MQARHQVNPLSRLLASVSLSIHFHKLPRENNNLELTLLASIQDAARGSSDGAIIMPSRQKTRSKITRLTSSTLSSLVPIGRWSPATSRCYCHLCYKTYRELVCKQGSPTASHMRCPMFQISSSVDKVVRVSKHNTHLLNIRYIFLSDSISLNVKCRQWQLNVRQMFVFVMIE